MINRLVIWISLSGRLETPADIDSGDDSSMVINNTEDNIGDSGE